MKVLTQGCLDSIVSVGWGRLPRNSSAASSGVVGVDVVNASTPSCKLLLRQGVDTLGIHAWTCQHLGAKYHQPFRRPSHLYRATLGNIRDDTRLIGVTADADNDVRQVVTLS